MLIKKMAKKTGCRAVHREAVNHSRSQQTLPDEISLRDEILELKRQVMVLKRTNEQYLVKLRKYEDETKRKDKQLEQLLDPRKNADVTKVLSTKGAAIVMNLKDQNNTLIQMILNKDLHIRRLVAELKMSKLYASTRKNESYRAEIARLRNLLIKSQETLKENVDVQQRTRSICVGENSLLEFSSSSDQSSPRDLDELRTTILSLESHIEHSNDLLSKKNQEISHLTDELNILRRFLRCKTYKNKAFDTCESKDVQDFVYKCSDHFTKTSSQQVLDTFEKDQEYENLPHSAPAAPTKSSDSKCTSQSTPSHNFENMNKIVPVLGKSLFHNIATDEILKEEKILSNSIKTAHTKEIWKRALNKFRELKREKVFANDQNQGKENEITTKFLCVETTKSVVESYQRKPENVPQEFDSSEWFEKKTDENGRLITPNGGGGSAVSDNDSIPEMCQNSEKNFNQVESFETEKLVSKEETEHVKAETPEFFESFQNAWNQESRKSKSLREIYRQSLDSSFDSESNYSMKQVQVEVQINSFSLPTDSDHSGSSTSVNSQKSQHGKTGGENCVNDFDFNDDDDDVIVREK